VPDWFVEVVDDMDLEPVNWRAVDILKRSEFQ
jgi:hypothetical protein